MHVVFVVSKSDSKMLQAAEAGVEGAVAVRFFAVELAAGPLETRVVHQVVADIDRRIADASLNFEAVAPRLARRIKCRNFDAFSKIGNELGFSRRLKYALAA